MITAFVMLCMALGGSSGGGLLANALLELGGALLLGYGVSRLGTTPLSRSSKILLAIAACWTGWCVLQLVPLPPSIWTLAPGRDVLLQRLQLAGVPLPWLPLSLNPEGTARHIASLLPPFAVGILILTRPPEDSRSLRWAIPLMAFASFVIGVLQLLGNVGSPLYFYQMTNFGMAVGLMANANHQATLMLCAIPFVASLADSSANRSKQAKGRELLLITVAAMLAIGVAISNSYAAFILALPVIVASWLIARPRSLGQARYVAIGMAVLGIVAVALVLITGPDVLDSKTAVAQSQVSRPVMYAVTAKAMLHFFPFGAGFGSFVPAFKLFENPTLVGEVFANHSHSDYLELALEGGLPAMLMIAILLLWWGRQAMTIWSARSPQRLDRAAVVATAAILAHSALDYPARTSTIAVVLAAGLALMATRGVKVVEEEAVSTGRHLRAE